MRLEAREIFDALTWDCTEECKPDVWDHSECPKCHGVGKVLTDEGEDLALLIRNSKHWRENEG